MRQHLLSELVLELRNGYAYAEARRVREAKLACTYDRTDADACVALWAVRATNPWSIVVVGDPCPKP